MVNQGCPRLWPLSPRWKPGHGHILVLEEGSQAVTSLLELWEGYTLIDSTDAAYPVFYPVMPHGNKDCDILAVSLNFNDFFFSPYP